MKFTNKSDAIGFWIGIAVVGLGLAWAAGPPGLIMAGGLIMIAASVTTPPPAHD